MDKNIMGIYLNKIFDTSLMLCFCIGALYRFVLLSLGYIFYFELIALHSDNLDSNSILENSISAKEKIIAELNMELHNIETTLSNEREEHMNEIKKLNALLVEKVHITFLLQCYFIVKLKVTLGIRVWIVKCRFPFIVRPGF